MFTAFARRAISTMKSVCRQRKAGTCRTSRTAAAGAISSKRWTSERTGIANASRILFRI